MSQNPSVGIGKRLARYRRLAGMSAQQLANLAGNGLTRGVIANIESGRKTDITVDQLIALAMVLGIPPVVLALPVEEPYRFIRSTEATSEVDEPGWSGGKVSRAFYLMDWFQGMNTIPMSERNSTEYEGEESEATLVAEATIEAVREYPKRKNALIQAQATADDNDPKSRDEVKYRELILEDHQRLLRQLKVNPKFYKIDE